MYLLWVKLLFIDSFLNNILLGLWWPCELSADPTQFLFLLLEPAETCLVYTSPAGWSKLCFTCNLIASPPYIRSQPHLSRAHGRRVTRA